MKLKNTIREYGVLTKAMHWALIFLVLVQVILVGLGNYAPSEEIQHSAWLWHKSNGINFLILGIFFCIWRLMNVRPPFPMNMTAMEVILAHFTHFVLYVLIIVIPLSGFVMSLTSGKGLFWYGWQLPNFLGTNKEISHFAKEIHNSSVWVFAGIIFLHIIGAIKHIWLKDKIATRMLRFK